jgi:hypothetical protein
LDAETGRLAELGFLTAMHNLEYYLLTGKDQYKVDHVSAFKNLATRTEFAAPLRQLFHLFSSVPERIMDASSPSQSNECLKEFLTSLCLPEEIINCVRYLGELLLAGDFSQGSHKGYVEKAKKASEDSKLDKDSRLALRLFLKGSETYCLQLEGLNGCLADPIANINWRRKAERLQGRRVQDLLLEQQVRGALMWLFRYGTMSRELLAQRMRLPFKDVVDIIEILKDARMVRYNGNVKLTGVGRFYGRCAVGFRIEYSMQ